MALDAQLITNILSAKALSILPVALAPMAAYSTDFSDQLTSGKTVLAVPLAGAGTTVTTDATDFESSDVTVNDATVTLNHYSAAFPITNEELQNGMRMGVKAGRAIDSLAQKLKAVVNSKITSAFNNTGVTVAAASFAVADTKTLFGQIKSGKKSLVLSPTAFSNLLPSSLTSFQMVNGALIDAHGFSAIYVDGNVTDVGVANTYGFACAPEALAIGSRLPDVADESALIVNQVIRIESLGIAVRNKVWSKPGSNVLWANYEIMFGAARGDTTALSIIKSS